MDAPFRPFNTVVIRTPALSLHEAYSFPEDAAALFARFRDSSLFREAIFLASPELYKEVIKHLEKGGASAKEEEKMALSLLKYHNRMATRCTPFGLFAGCSTARIGEHTNIAIQPTEAGKSHLRFDMHFLCKLTDHLITLPALRRLMRYFPNTSLYPLGDKWRYYEKYYTGTIRQHKISDVDRSEYLDALLDKATGGAAYTELAALLVNDEITEEEATAFIDELIDCHLLESELEPSTTGKNTLSTLIEKLQAVATREANASEDLLAETITRLQWLAQQVSDIHAPGHPDNIASYQRIIAQIKAWDYPMEEKYLFQADLAKTSAHDAVLGEALLQKIEAGIGVMANYSKKGSSPALTEFKTKFTDRYEDAWVPLLEVMDNETGLGFPATVSGGNVPEYLAEKVDGGQAAAVSYTLSDTELPLVKKIMAAYQSGAYEVVLDDPAPEKPLPAESFLSTFTVMANIIGDPDSPDCRIQFGYAGNNGSAAVLPARFSHTDPAIAQLVTDITAKEQELHPDQVLAEIVHFPESRIGNVLLRPRLRTYEIPFLAQSDLPGAEQLLPEDLWVTVKKGRILLYSRKLGKEVIPKLTNAHNFNMKPMPVYQFLCALQNEQQDTTGLMFTLPPLLHSLSVFTPRIRWREIIFREAGWLFTRKETDPLVKGAQTLADWQAQWKLPSQIVIADGDNELFLNLDNTMHQRLLLAELKKRTSVEIHEMLFAPDAGVSDPLHWQQYANEVVLCWHKTAPVSAILHDAIAINTADKTTFFPGDAWLYYKLYCGHRTADQVLALVVWPLTETLLEQGRIKQWFYIRYADPEPHIRLRFLLTDVAADTGFVALALREALSSFLESGQVNRLVVDNYRRELDRYGAATMALSEALFCSDSRFMVQAIAALQHEEGEQVRWKYALLCIDQLFSAFGYDGDQKERLAKKHLAGFLPEMGITQKKWPPLEDTYRKHKKEIEQMMTGTDELTPGLAALRPVLDARGVVMETLCAEIRDRNAEQGKDVFTEELTWSYVHMMVNRLFRSQQRKNEMACYYLLSQYYTSLNVRKKQPQQKKTEAKPVNVA
jgi:lantibiotic biosynthesis protein